MVARHRGEVVHRSAHGVLDPETRYVLRPDTVLWLASLSKVIVATALLMLADEGRLNVEDPVSDYIPGFGDPGRVRVLRPGSPSPFTTPFGPPPERLPQYDGVPAERRRRHWPVPDLASTPITELSERAVFLQVRANLGSRRHLSARH
jgi:CubicO group peptidase (beta-lactamase class C family)